VAIGAVKASSTSRDGCCMRQEVVVLGAATASSTARCRGDQRYDGVIHGRMVHGGWLALRRRQPRLDGDGGAKLPHENNGVTPLRGNAVRSRQEDRREAGWRWCPGLCDAIREMGRCDDVATGAAKVSSMSRGIRCARQDVVVIGVATASPMARGCR
jgi:hypothetical protein